MMKIPLLSGLALLSAIAGAQAHGTPASPSIRALNFILGDWHGTQVFNAKLAGRPMSAKMELHAKRIIGDRYVEEQITATLPGRPPSDVRHLATFSTQANALQSWWFDDANVGPLAMTGNLDGKNVVLMSHPAEGSKAPVLRATYMPKSKTEFSFKLEMKMGPTWTELFVTDYQRDAG